MTDQVGAPREPAERPAERVAPAVQASADDRLPLGEAPAERRGPARVWTLLTAAGLGVVVGLVGTTAHRGVPPWGLLVAVLATLSAAVFARGLGKGLGLAAYGGGLLAITQLANSLRPGGDVLVAADALGYAWLTLPLVMVGIASFLPHRWFERDPAVDPSDVP